MDGSERVSGDWSTSCQLSSLPLPASVAPFLTAGAPNCMPGDVWVEGGLSSGCPAESGLGLEWCSGVNSPFDPWVNLSTSSLPGANR